MRRLAAAAIAALLLACGGAPSVPAAAPVAAVAAAPELAEIVRLEGARTGGARLSELARAGASAAIRARAMVALGRQGDEASLAVLTPLLDDADATVRDAAAEALGLLASPAAEAPLVAALAAHPTVALAAALGRCGSDAAAAAALAPLLGGPGAELRAAAARAIGILGYRKQPVGDDTIAALVAAVGTPAADAELRYAVAYALFRVPAPELAAPARTLLAQLALDSAPETRAIAVRGLAAHHAGDDRAVAAALADADWRVQVQAVRALAATTPTPTHLVVWATNLLVEVQNDASFWASPRIHPVLEVLTLLGERTGEAEVAVFFARASSMVQSAGLSGGGDAAGAILAVSTADCLTAQASARLGRRTVESVIDCGGSSPAGYPVHLRKILALDAAAAGDALVGKLARDPDARVRAAVATKAAHALTTAPAPPGALALVQAALADADLLVVATAADALAEATTGVPAALTDTIAARLVRVPAAEPELALSLLGALCAAPGPITASEPALRAAHAHASGVVRSAARECLTKLTGADPGPGAATGTAPATPADPTALLGRRVVWTVTTTRGPFVLELDPDLAPWNVATLTALAEKHFYDGTLWHRVVADFVVQGGDPTGSGAGGPGYTVPAEASSRRYTRGSIGIADAGKDTGGSQWFVMHSASPHLEERYTIVGQVTSGMDVVDRLHVGDKIVSVRVEVSAR